MNKYRLIAVQFDVGDGKPIVVPACEAARQKIRFETDGPDFVVAACSVSVDTARPPKKIIT